jgi:diacylglycerol kinase (ATP)
MCTGEGYFHFFDYFYGWNYFEISMTRNSANQKQKGIGAFLMGFVHAFKGIFFLIASQRNARIHLLALVLVVAAGFYFSISSTEWLVVIISIGMVFSAEAFNTAIEELTDKVSPEYNKSAGRIKDLAAGAVLLSAIAALIVGVIIFGTRIF